MTSIVKSFEQRHDINKCKLVKINIIFTHYRKAAQEIAKAQWRTFYTDGCFNRNQRVSVKSQLGAGYLQTVQYQVVKTLKSFISNRKNDFTRFVYRNTKDKKLIKELLRINHYQKWFDTENILARKIFKHILSKHRKPSFKNANLELDAKVLKISKCTKGHFDYWLQLSTLEKYKTIYLPILSNLYYENAPGKQNNFCQINRDKNNKLRFVFIKTSEPEPYIPETEDISIDFGIRILFATNHGDLFGRNLIDRLRCYDNEIQRLKKNNKPIYHIKQTVRDLLKQEVNRALNRIVEVYKPAKLNVEKIDFRDQSLSKQMNRILSNCGRSIVQAKLDYLGNIGITVHETHAAYSSQTCHGCHYVDPKNRKNQGEFQCKLCGLRCNADVNSSRVIHFRSSKDNSESYTVYKNKASILNAVVNECLSRIEREKSCLMNRRAITLLQRNPYYAGVTLEGFS